jgi:hypothetical protein
MKSIMLNEINGAAGLASPQAPSLRLNCLSSLWLAFLKELKDESGYKSFFGKLRMNESEYNGSHDSV